MPITSSYLIRSLRRARTPFLAVKLIFQKKLFPENISCQIDGNLRALRVIDET
jgi:hypothetical protein